MQPSGYMTCQAAVFQGLFLAVNRNSNVQAWAIRSQEQQELAGRRKSLTASSARTGPYRMS